MKKYFAVKASCYLVLGCMGKPDTPTSPDPKANRAAFSIEAADVEKLGPLHCRLQSVQVTCEDSQSDQLNRTNSKLNALTFGKNRIERQCEALAEVRSTLEARLKGGNFKSKSISDGQTLITNLATVSTSRQEKWNDTYTYTEIPTH